MVFSSAFLLDDLEFLTQLDYPADVLATQPAKVRFFFERAQTSWQLLNEEIRQPLPERQPQRQQSGQSSGAATFAALRTLYNGTHGGLLPPSFPTGSPTRTCVSRGEYACLSADNSLFVENPSP